MGFLIFLFFAIVVGVPALALLVIQNERIAKRDERMGIHDGPVQSLFSKPETGEGDTAQPTDWSGENLPARGDGLTW